MSTPQIDTAAPLEFVVNAASGRSDTAARRELIESALRQAGRAGTLHFSDPAALEAVAGAAAIRAGRNGSAVVAVGGDGTMRTVAEAAHREGCAMGLVPQGTFNYFARTHGIPAEPEAAMQALLAATTPQPVQVGRINERIFLVNASLGLYPTLLEDREAFKARFGRSRLVALVSALATLWREHRQLVLTIERDGRTERIRTPTVFIGNNRLQFEQVGLAEASAIDAGRIVALMLRPIGTARLFWLLARGAFGRLGAADDVISFDFEQLRIEPRGRRRVKVACDGEVSWMRAPLVFGVAPEPLRLLRSPAAGPTPDSREAAT